MTQEKWMIIDKAAEIMKDAISNVTYSTMEKHKLYVASKLMIEAFAERRECFEAAKWWLEHRDREIDMDNKHRWFFPSSK